MRRETKCIPNNKSHQIRGQSSSASTNLNPPLSQLIAKGRTNWTRTHPIHIELCVDYIQSLQNWVSCHTHSHKHTIFIWSGVVRRRRFGEPFGAVALYPRLGPLPAPAPAPCRTRSSWESDRHTEQKAYTHCITATTTIITVAVYICMYREYARIYRTHEEWMVPAYAALLLAGPFFGRTRLEST